MKNTAVNLPELCKVRESVDLHLSEARRLYEQQAHDGDATRTMKGFYHHTNANAGHVRMTLIGLPFIQLKTHHHRTEAELTSMAIINRLLGYSGHNATTKDRPSCLSDTAHTLRTLFQYLNPRDNSRRDLNQVVCHVLGPHDKRYLCVSQVWVFIVNEGE